MILKILIAIPVTLYLLWVLAMLAIPNKYVTYTFEGRRTSLPVDRDIFWQMKTKMFFLMWACFIVLGVVWYIPL